MANYTKYKGTGRRSDKIRYKLDVTMPGLRISMEYQKSKETKILSPRGKDRDRDKT